MVTLLVVTGLTKVNLGAVSPSPSSVHMVFWLQLVKAKVTVASIQFQFDMFIVLGGNWDTTDKQQSVQ